MLNPSTADDIEDDPTILVCMAFARLKGCGSLHVVNLFAWRTKNKDELELQKDPIGKDNDKWILSCCKVADKIFVAWGESKYCDIGNRAKDVSDMLKKGDFEAFCIKKNKDGTPTHPLSCIRNLEPKKFSFEDMTINK
jgi:hypothetical protein|tara:strand:+ start:415 stop:828 length:414 start_codon:yes stop_codon:yes gene_type:complete